jgi:signal transduction histidine kinase
MDVEQKELAFFGKIAAGMTHEMRNVLAIINESNGLMSDLLAMAKDSSFPYRDKFLRSISKIEAQVKRGVVISGNFNRFAHSMDNPIANIDLNELVEQTVALAQRFARLKNIELQACLSSEPVFLVTFPFRLQMALTKAVEAGIACLPEGGVIELQVDAGRDCPFVYVNFNTPGANSAEFREAISTFLTWQDFLELSVQLDASVEWRKEADGICITLPKALHSKAPIGP